MTTYYHSDYDDIEEPTERTRKFYGFQWESSNRIDTRAPTKADLRYKREFARRRSHGKRGRNKQPAWKGRSRQEKRGEEGRRGD